MVGFIESSMIVTIGISVVAIIDISIGLNNEISMAVII